MKIKSGSYWFEEKILNFLARKPRTEEWMNGSLINNPKYLFHIHLKCAQKNYLSCFVNTRLKERFVAKKVFFPSSLKWFLFYGKTNHTWNRLIILVPFLSDTQFIYFILFLSSQTLNLLWHTSTAVDFSSTFDSPARGKDLKWERKKSLSSTRLHNNDYRYSCIHRTCALQSSERGWNEVSF